MKEVVGDQGANQDAGRASCDGRAAACSPGGTIVGGNFQPNAGVAANRRRATVQRQADCRRHVAGVRETDGEFGVDVGAFGDADVAHAERRLNRTCTSDLFTSNNNPWTTLNRINHPTTRCTELKSKRINSFNDTEQLNKGVPLFSTGTRQTGSRIFEQSIKIAAGR